MNTNQRIGKSPVLFLAVLAALGAPGILHAQTTQPAPARERLSLDQGWLFHEGDIPFPEIKGQNASYNNAKAGVAWGAAAPIFNDSAWKTVDLPHDWAVEQDFDPKANPNQGYRDRGMGWYRRYFKLDPADHGKYLEIQLDGIATHATIWVNGVLAARSFCGYTSTYVDITPFAKFGDNVNTIAVQVDAVSQEGWWYEGAGLYRHTWLLMANPVHITTDGVFAQPVKGTDGKWSIPVEVNLESTGKAPANVSVESTLIGPDGKTETSAAGGARITIDPLKGAVAKFSIPVSDPQLWSPDSPTLYTVRTVVTDSSDKVIDEVTTHCGFRALRFDPNLGFFLNDKPLKIKGTCNHQDMAGVGVAVPDSIWDFRIRKLKEMGANAYRCAHNAPAAEFLDACDRVGILVMDENRNFGSSPEYIHQLQWMVRRDRNHPSVFLWSVFNEEPSQGSEMGYEMVRRMSAAVKELDTTRPVTAAQSNSMLSPINASQAADVAGFNYRPGDYDAYHAKYPDKPMFSSEDTSAVMTRDEFITDKRGDDPVLDEYDDQIAGSWALLHRPTWKNIDTRPFVAGTMVWTGFDYRGEPQPLNWPSAGSSFGCMDLCGFPKSAFYIHQAEWLDKPVLHLIPHWNWAGSEGKPIKVMALTNLDQVELILNGKSLGKKPVDKYEMLTVDVPYEAGKLEAIGYKGDQQAATFTVETTGKAATIQLVPDRSAIANDGRDAVPVAVEIVDDQGRVVPTAGDMVRFTLSGPGAIIGLNNGDPNCHESEKGDAHSAFHGLAQVILQSRAGNPGAITLHATAEGLKGADLTLTATPATLEPSVPAVSAPPPPATRGRRGG